MTIDVQNAAYTAGGEIFPPPPFVVEGLRPVPPTATVSTQASGDDSTVLRAGITSGRARLVDYVKDFTSQEVTVVSTSGSQYTDGTTGLASGYAVWATAVAVQHRPAAGISIVWVMAAVAAVADAAKPTVSEIKSAIGDDDGQKRWVVLGDVMFYRSADTVIDHRVDYERRPAYVDADSKSSSDAAQDDQSTMGLRYFGAVPLHVIMASITSLPAGTQIADFEAPALPFGGLVGQLEFIPSETLAGGTSASFRPNVDNPGASATVAADGDDLTLTTDAVGSTASNTRAPGSYTTAPYFKPGARIAIELEAISGTYTAGQGTMLVHIWECVPFGVDA